MKDDASPLNLSELTDFQFGPSWARSGSTPAVDYTRLPREAREQRSSERGERRPRRHEGERRSIGREQRGERSERGHAPRNRRGEAPERRPHRELPEPAAGYRVELRPANAILEVFAAEIQKQKRTLPLIELARVVMAAKNRYDLVFMKMEEGAPLIHSRKGDGACWLTREEALSYLPKAPWLAELYSTEEMETEAPKGQFTAVAVCSLGGEVIGPVSWHGYQAALMNLYRSKYSRRMPLDAFRNSVHLNKDEEAVAAWLKSASHKTVWKPTREGAAELVLNDWRAVEADFAATHFDEIYETTDKVFINGATERARLSPGLAAHLAILSDRTRKFPQMLIPNLCHGMARFHLPIFKWHGKHYTGPSRVRAIPEGTVLADRMMAIINWSRENSGKTCDLMFAALSGVPAGTDEAGKAAAAEAYAPYVADMIWLLEQGYIVVTGDNAVWFPKGESAPSAAPQSKEKKAPAKKKSGKRPADQKAPAAAPAEEPAAPTPDEAPDEATPVEEPADVTPAAEAPAAATPDATPAEPAPAETPV
ncbi:MAG: hypothetical protein ACI4O9_02700 [Akkermansia sp.]